MFRCSMIIFCAFFLIGSGFAGDYDIGDGSNGEGGRKKLRSDPPSDLAYAAERPKSPLTVGSLPHFLHPAHNPPRGHGTVYAASTYYSPVWPGAAPRPASSHRPPQLDAVETGEAKPSISLTKGGAHDWSKVAEALEEVSREEAGKPDSDSGVAAPQIGLPLESSPGRK